MCIFFPLIILLKCGDTRPSPPPNTTYVPRVHSGLSDGHRKICDTHLPPPIPHFLPAGCCLSQQPTGGSHGFIFSLLPFTFVEWHLVIQGMAVKLGRRAEPRSQHTEYSPGHSSCFHYIVFLLSASHLLTLLPCLGP